MSFPIDPLPLKSEMFIDGAWRDLTAMGRIRNESDIVITRGKSNEQASISPSTCSFTINNRDGLFSNRNPLSTYYRKLRRNVPFRQSVTETTAWARFPQWLSSYTTGLSGSVTPSTGLAGRIYTADKNVLDITGDIDIRVDVEPDNWIMSNSVGMNLAMKWNQATNNRSWNFFINYYGHPGIAWSSSGSAITGTAIADAPIDTSLPRQAIRVTVDVNNGSGGADFRFYTSDSVNGVWTQIGSTLTASSTTSFFSGNAPVSLGRIEDGVSYPLVYAWPFAGRFHRFQLRNGIGGTVVADMDATVQTPGATSWSDGLGTPNTWIVSSPAEITTSDYRFYGETAELPQEWDSTGTDVFVPVTASGVTRRLTQGESPINSTLRSYLGGISNNGYWPCEDGPQSTALANVTVSGNAGQVVDVAFGADLDFPASAGAVTVNSSATRIRGMCTAATSSGDMYLLFFFKLTAVPVSTVDVIDLWSTGTTERTRFSVTSTAFVIESWDSDNVSLGSSSVLHLRDLTEWIGVQIRISDTGAGFTTTTQWFQVGEAGMSSSSFNVATGTVGVPTRWQVGGDADLADASLAHIQTGATSFSIFTAEFVKVARAYVGEYAAERWLRILAENGLTGWVIGNPAESQTMGYQPIATLMNILNECVTVDRALMFEPRDQLGYFYRTRRSLLRQHGPVLDYSAGELSGTLRPIDDDQATRNDVTVSRPRGSSARSVVQDGELGVDAVGRYDSSITRNAYLDSQLSGLAGMETFLGTWDETRYPSVQVELARSVFLTTAGLTKAQALTAVDIGDRFDLTGLPAWLPPDDVALMVQGYRETLRNRGRDIRWNTSPYGPYQYVNNTGDATDDNPYQRAAAVASYLTTAVDSDDTSLQVITERGPLWGTTAGKPQNFPMDIEVGGEVMTVSGITGLIEDAFGRTSASSFGTADIGGAYTLSGGSASDFAVSSGLGRITGSGSANVQRLAYLTGQQAGDFDVYFTSAVSAVATGSQLVAQLHARLVSPGNCYRFEVFYDPAGRVDIRIVSTVAFAMTQIGSTAANVALYSAGTLITTRCQGTGNLLRMKSWLASASEPKEWQVSGTSSAYTADGYLGLGAWRTPGNTNVNPETRFDNLSVFSPQRLTISQRSVNGVVKSHAAREFVQVKNRFYAIL